VPGRVQTLIHIHGSEGIQGAPPSRRSSARRSRCALPRKRKPYELGLRERDANRPTQGHGVRRRGFYFFQTFQLSRWDVGSTRAASFSASAICAPPSSAPQSLSRLFLARLYVGVLTSLTPKGSGGLVSPKATAKREPHQRPDIILSRTAGLDAYMAPDIILRTVYPGVTGPVVNSCWRRADTIEMPRHSPGQRKGLVRKRRPSHFPRRKSFDPRRWRYHLKAFAEVLRHPRVLAQKISARLFCAMTEP